MTTDNYSETTPTPTLRSSGVVISAEDPKSELNPNHVYII